MPNLHLSINYKRPIGAAQWTQREALRHVIKFLEGVASGHVEGESVKLRINDSVAVQGVGTVFGQAVGLVVMASSSGTVGPTIGGTGVTTTWATSDTATATAIAAAIRAHATVGLKVTATNKLAKLTCASVLAGDTVDINGMRFTAIANGATPAAHGEFSVGASDTACALNLVTAINRHPALAARARAASIAGAVYIGLVDDRSPAAFEAIRNPSSTITVNTAIPVAGAVNMLIAQEPGTGSNHITVTVAGTNESFSTNGTAGQLGQGCGGAVPSGTLDLVP